MDWKLVEAYVFKLTVNFFPASIILEKIIGTLVDKQLLTIERLEMLTTSNLRTFRFSWLNKEHLSVKGKEEMDETKITDVLHTTSIICPVKIVKYEFLVNWIIEWNWNNCLFKILQKLISLELWGTLFWSLFNSSQMKPITQFHKILSTFQNLQELNISFTKEGDDCFRILGVYCKDLR